MVKEARLGESFRSRCDQYWNYRLSTVGRRVGGSRSIVALCRNGAAATVHSGSVVSISSWTIKQLHSMGFSNLCSEVSVTGRSLWCFPTLRPADTAFLIVTILHLHINPRIFHEYFANFYLVHFNIGRVVKSSSRIVDCTLPLVLIRISVAQLW